MNAEQTAPTTSDERVMGALSHFFGMFAALIVWATQKDKSRFLKFQSLQALAFDGIVMIGSMLLIMCMMGLSLVGALAVGLSAAQVSSSPDRFFSLSMASMMLPFAMTVCFMPVSLAAWVVRIIAAVSVGSGRNFRYPWIGSLVDRFLADSSEVSPSAN